VPNAIVNLPRADFEELEKLLGGRMSPTRWVTLVVREHVRKRVPARRLDRRRDTYSVRVTGHAPPEVYNAIIRESHRLHAATAQLIYWIVKTALEAKVVPNDSTGLPDTALLNKRDPERKAARAHARVQLEKKKRERRARIRAIAQKRPAPPRDVLLSQIPGLKTPIGSVRVSVGLLRQFRFETARAPRISMAAAFEVAMIDWVAARALARSAARTAAPAPATPAEPTPRPRASPRPRRPLPRGSGARSSGPRPSRAIAATARARSAEASSGTESARTSSARSATARGGSVVSPLETVRARLERAKRDLARAEGELSAAERDREADRARLCEILGCEPGGEREALAKLEAAATAAEKEVAELLDAARKARDERAAAEVPA
jgi:hypothetical protein